MAFLATGNLSRADVSDHTHHVYHLQPPTKATWATVYWCFIRTARDSTRK